MLLLFQRQPSAITSWLPIQYWLPGLVSQTSEPLALVISSLFTLILPFLSFPTLYFCCCCHSFYLHLFFNLLPHIHSTEFFPPLSLPPGFIFSTNAHFPQFSKHLSHNQISDFCLYVLLVFHPHSGQFLPFLPSSAP